MSHVSKVEAQVSDLDAFEQAVANLGGELRRGQAQFHYYAGQKSPCVHAVGLKGTSSEIGLRRIEAGKDVFDLAYDSYGQGAALDKAFGSQLVGLKNEYLAVVGERELLRGGYRVQRSQEGQQILLYATA